MTGLHITSMSGAWLAIVQGFAGMRVKDDPPFQTIRSEKLARL